ncbi:hypothetical protein [Streptomyces rishiriensis]|nr:hypothetical protein [Streptomyces rishiriensis]
MTAPGTRPRSRSFLAVVRDDEGRLTGLGTLDDLLARLLHPQTT